MTNREVCEAFAEGKKEARNLQGSLYIHAGILFSYGEHWPLALWFHEFALVNCDNYTKSDGKVSRTTAHHRSLVLNALLKERVPVIKTTLADLQARARTMR